MGRTCGLHPALVPHGTPAGYEDARRMEHRASREPALERWPHDAPAVS